MTMTEASAPRTSTSKPAAPSGVQRIVLLGFMGAGKTSVGRVLAATLGWKFQDLDAHLEQRAGQTVRAIFAQQGEAHFRRLESSALANALGGTETVLALGGGTPEQLTNRLLLEQTPGTLIVHLDAPFATLYDRCMLEELSLPGSPVTGAEPSLLRPVLSSPVEAQARYTARRPFYRMLASLTVATAEQTPAESVDELLQLFQSVKLNLCIQTDCH